MQRDFIGYASHLPKVAWPKGARVAVSFVLNYEEGAEQNILDGDIGSESYLTDFPGMTSLKEERSFLAESLFEYGSRAGVWRLLHLFDEFSLPITLFATGLALERNLPLAEYLKHSPHEIVGHGYRWINYRNIDEPTEREHIHKTLHTIETLTHKKVYGWYTGRRGVNTRNIIVSAGLRYDSESYCDDLPYWVEVSGKKHLIIPYSLETNDARYALSPGWNTGEDCFNTLKGAFDQLYCEGNEFPKMMSIGLHARFSGRPARCDALRRFIEYMKQYDQVWICTRNEIADHWYRYHPPTGDFQ